MTERARLISADKKPRIAGLVAGENIKEKQQRLKEERETRRSQLDDRHRFILRQISDFLMIEYAEAEDSILDGYQLDQVEQFFAANGSPKLMFFYQEIDADTISEAFTFRVGPPALPAGQGGPSKAAKPPKPKLFITDGKDMALRGVCIVYIRNDPAIAITIGNVGTDIGLTVVDCRNPENPSENQSKNFLTAIQTFLNEIYVPMFRRQDDWGRLKVKSISQFKTNFVTKLETFSAVLEGAKSSVDDKIELKPCKYDLSTLKTFQDMSAAAAQSETLETVEDTMRIWIKQIEQVIAESEQMRREADNIGPRAELDYWKRRLAKFNYLLNQIKGPKVKAVLGVLQIAKSKMIKEWQELDKHITDSTNEAKDNLKFLSTLEKHCVPLYNCDPVTMLDSIPGLINAIRMINSISMYYNTSERMTSLFVKVTNQMITSCKAYVSGHGTETIWSQEAPELLRKLMDCIRLNDEYQKQFHKVKAQLDGNTDERPFDFSEMYIFGKFDTFCRRLKKIMEMFSIIQTYSSLQDCKIEGVEMLYAKFQVIVTGMRKKPYDFLDQRKTDFDVDFDEFKRLVGELHAGIQMFIDQRFANIHDTARAIRLLKKFEKLKLPNINYEEKYNCILLAYQKDLETVARIYEKLKTDPPISRNMPPVAGKISWANQLYQRIKQPMDVLQSHESVLQNAEGRKTIKLYNKLTRVLFEYEMLYQRAWTKQVEIVLTGLNATLLVRHPDTGQLFVNFDPEIGTLIRETECMNRYNYEIPAVALSVRAKKDHFKELHQKMKNMLNEYERVNQKIPHAFASLMTEHKAKVERVLKPGLTVITWTSLNIDEYVFDVHEHLSRLELLIDRASQLMEFRIEAILHDISTTQLCELPEDEPWTMEYFLERTQVLCARKAASLQSKSVNVEDATNELINLLVGEFVEVDESAPDAPADPVDEQAADGSTEAGEPTETGESAVAVAAKPVDHRASRPSSGLSALDPVARKKKEMRERMEEDAVELLAHFNYRNLDALLKVTRSTLEALRRRITSSMTSLYMDRTKRKAFNYPFFKTNAILAIPNIVMQPSLDDVQQAVNKVAQMIVSVSKGISQWSRERKKPKKAAPPGKDTEGIRDGRVSVLSHTGSDEGGDGQPAAIHVQTRNYYRSVSENKEISKLISMLSTAINSNKKEVASALETFKVYHVIWRKDRDEEMQDFQKMDPRLSEYEAQILHYEDWDKQIQKEPEFYNVGPIALYTERLKLGLMAETRSWRLLYGRACNQKYKNLMENILDFIDDLSKRLNRPIKDLDDIRYVMSTLNDIRENFIRVDMTIGPIEECYAMLVKRELPVAREEAERCDTLRYSWEKLLALSVTVQDQMMSVQPRFKEQLVGNVQAFAGECESFYGAYREKGPMVPGIPPREASDRLTVMQTHFDTLYRKFITYSGGEQLFGLAVNKYPQLLHIKKELNLLQKLYSLYNQVLDTVKGYYDILWEDIDIEQINNELQEFQNKCRKLPKGLKEYEAFEELRKTIDDFNEMVPLLELMTNRAMQKRHWQRITDLTSVSFDVDSDNFTLKNVLGPHLLKYKEEIEDICISAVKEKDIEAKLKVVVNDWNAREFSFSSFKNRGELLLKGDSTAEIISNMEDSMMVLSSLQSNRYNAPFKKTIQTWVQNLSNSMEVIESWMTVQNLWVYLEAVFVGGDIAKQLPQEAKRFTNIDKSWIKIMTRAHETPNVILCCVGDDTLMQLLPHLLEQLELCQKSLTGYLEKKRLLFPRFFFVSDPALLEILGQASDCHTIQAHLLSIFDNTKTVKFHDKKYDLILSVQSSEGEPVELDRPVTCEGNVEMWLKELMITAQRSLHGVIRQAAVAIQDPNFNLLEFLNLFVAQVGLLGIQMIWTRDATDALLNAKYDKKIMPQTNQHFLDMLNQLIEQTTRELSKVERTKFETLITIHVHQRDIFDDLVRMHIKSPSDFEWLKQSRFYFVEDQDRCIISITDVDFIYQNEFLGCTERLVITPLTDR